MLKHREYVQKKMCEKKECVQPDNTAAATTKMKMYQKDIKN